MIYRQTVRLIAGLALITVLGGADLARGVPILNGDTLPDNDPNGQPTKPNSQYKINHAADSVDYNATDPNGTSQQGTLTINHIFSDCDALELTFMQTVAPTVNGGASGGLRLQLAFEITNASGKPWSGFWIKTLEDPNDMVPENSQTESEDHKHHAHFHPNTTTPPGPPMVSGFPVTGFTTPPNAAINNQTMFLVGGGTQDSGSGFSMKNFFLHERNLVNGTTHLQRNFKLILMPHCVPEPSSFLLLMLVGVGATCGRCFLGMRVP